MLRKLGTRIMEGAGYKVIACHDGQDAWDRFLQDEKAKVINAMRPIDCSTLVRGQYVGYRDEPGVDPGSTVETFADGKAKATLASVNERLATDHGIVLVQPAFTRYYVELGEISSYPPGYKENAGIFCHNNSWIHLAHCMLGDGDQAFEYYRLLGLPCPPRVPEPRLEPRADDLDRVRAGPVTAEGEAADAFGVCTRTNDHRPGAVPEKDAGSPVAPVDDRMQFPALAVARDHRQTFPRG